MFGGKLADAIEELFGFGGDLGTGRLKNEW
jgi:hypothetical protein